MFCRHMVTVRIDQYVKVLRENCLAFMTSEMRQRLHFILGNLIQQSLYHRDVMDRLLSNSQLSDSAFDWMRVLKYHMEVRTVLLAKADGSGADFRDDMRLTSQPPGVTTSANINDDEGEPRSRRTSVVKPVIVKRTSGVGECVLKPLIYFL